ncbi:hypothetical protein BDZ88DRAFT_503553 [Geranomyces variabilis]|nr:hypothetical protein BDZ88DRAFT_503553 [Geranomyces variabilis]KAJ3132980.1 hypothetical protein HDU90_006516 [Geranomyces variabilis]
MTAIRSSPSVIPHRSHTPPSRPQSSTPTPGEDRLFVNLTQVYDGRPDSPDRKVSFVLPAAHVPKPLSAARRHVKPPDPVPLNSIQATSRSSSPASAPLSQDETAAQQQIQLLHPIGRRIHGWGDDSDHGDGWHVMWQHDERSRGARTEKTRSSDGSKPAPSPARTAAQTPGHYEPTPNNPSLLQRASSSARHVPNPPATAPSLTITNSRPTSASINGPTHPPTKISPPPPPSAPASTIPHYATPFHLPPPSTIVPPTPAPPHHHTPTTPALTPATPHGFPRVQTARTNLDRYRIEQIALRRLRFVVENDQAEPEHLAMVDLVEQGHVPLSLLHKYFGPAFLDILDLRVLILRSIERRRMINAPQTPSPPHAMFAPRPHATTPSDVLSVLQTIEKRALRAGREKERRLARSAGRKKEDSGQGEPGNEKTGLEVEGRQVGSKRNPADALSPHQILKMIDRRRQRHLKL